jgi:predicted phage terminase large subunit-like protein
LDPVNDIKSYTAAVARAEERAEDEASTQFLRHKALTDLFYLGYEILGWKDAKSPTRRRKRIDPTFHRWLARRIQAPGDKMIMVQRLALKTTWIKLRIVQLLLNNPYLRIGLFSVSARLVEQELAAIKMLFASRELRDLFPDLIPDPGKEYKNWEKSNASQLTVFRPRVEGVRIPDEPQIIAVGSLAKITGMHLDYLFPDDIIDKDSVATADQMEKSEDWWAFMQSILEIEGETCMTGTFYHYADLYNKIIKEGQFKRKNIHIRSCYDIHGEPTYKAWFTKRDLEKIRRRQGEYIFNCQYRLDPAPKGDRIFPPPQPTYETLGGDNYQYYIAVDPAVSTKRTSDYTAIVVAAVAPGKWIYIVEALQVKRKTNEIADILIKKCLQYKPVRVGMELGLQEHLKYYLDLRKTEYTRMHGVRVPMNILPIPIPTRVSKADKINDTLGTFIRSGRVRIHKSCTDLIRQMDTFTGSGKEHDDLVDACSMLFACIEGFGIGRWKKMWEAPDNSWQSWFKEPESEGWRGNFAA